MNIDDKQGPQLPFAKWTCYRYGQSSAMIVSYPGHVEAGSTSDALVQYEDILPTLIEAAAGGMHDQYGSGLYDMQGRLLSTAPLSGLYITGGKKVGIK